MWAKGLLPEYAVLDSGTLTDRPLWKRWHTLQEDRETVTEEVGMKFRLLLSILGTALFIVGCAQSDVGITTSVKAQLAADELVRAREINVDTKDRVVTLTGVVQTAAEETKALEIARNTDGVANVVDSIAVATRGEEGAASTSGRDREVPPATPEVGAVTDAGITAKVKTKLLADAAVSGLQIDVDTRNRIVTLTGTVKSDTEKARAVELASTIENVIRVEDRLTVRPQIP
jgi:hyperosmotically inducible periplasmic protein